MKRERSVGRFLARLVCKQAEGDGEAAHAPELSHASSSGDILAKAAIQGLGLSLGGLPSPLLSAATHFVAVQLGRSPKDSDTGLIMNGFL